jgi:Uma2 family endonuclease
MPGGRPTSPVGDYVPALVVEIVSLSNRAAEIARKTNEWLEAGASLVWIVFPELKQVNVYESPTSSKILHLGDTLSGGDVLPGFQLKLQTLFA